MQTTTALKETPMKFLTLLILPALLSTPTLAQTSASLPLNQEVQSVTLEQKEFETLYRTDQVPSTCYRSETHGTRTECHTVYDHQCHTDYQQQCGYRYYPVCQNVPRNVCYPRQMCHTVPDSVCNSHGCVSVPRQVCETQNQCSTQWDSVCHNEQRYECQSVPHTSCQDIPRQACTEIPNVVQVAYSCTKPVQVAIGQQLKLETNARITLRFQDFGTLGALSESLNASLSNDEVALSSQSQETFFQIVDQTKSEQMLSATEKQIDTTITLHAIRASELNALSSVKGSDGRLSQDRIEFTLSAYPNVPFQGHLELLQHRTFGGYRTITDQDFASRLLVGAGTRQTLMLGALGVGGLRSHSHQVKLSLSLDLEALRKGAVNPELLNRLNGTPAVYEFEAKP